MSYNQSNIHLNVRNLGKHFDRNRVFDDISVTHSDGVLGIAGSNGSGKSTLLQCLAGLKRPTTGSVEWQLGNKNISSQSLQKLIGYAAPYINLYSELSCAENLDFLLKLRSIKERKQAIKKALNTTGIWSLASKPFGKLSTGQQQRLRLAAAIIHQPEILMLDEPGSNLDEAGRNLVQSLVDSFKRSDKMIFIASNNPDELALCDRVYSVEDEQIL